MTNIVLDGISTSTHIIEYAMRSLLPTRYGGATKLIEVGVAATWRLFVRIPNHTPSSNTHHALL